MQSDSLECNAGDDMRTALLILCMLALAGSWYGAAAATPGTRGNPIPMGQVGTFHDLQIRVLSYNPDAGDELRSRNKNNKQATRGNVLILTKIEVSYHGDDAERPDVYRYSLVGDSNAALPSVQCSTYGDSIHDEALRADLFPGGVSTFELCIEAPKVALKGLQLYVSDVNENRLFFALTPTPVATPAP